MNVGRAISREVQVRAREIIESAGLDLAAKQLRVSGYLLAKAAAGARVAELSADALETRIVRLTDGEISQMIEGGSK